MSDRALDLEAVEAFVRIAELGSFTRAADALGISQVAVSLRMKRLEDRVGRRLIERTSRHVQLSGHGSSFLEHARALVGAHQRALASMTNARERLSIGLSDHVAGPDLPQVLASLSAAMPGLLIDVRIGSSAELLQSFDRRELDAVVARVDLGRSDGVPIADEPFGWFAAPHWQPREAELLPIATMAQPCGVRALAARLLDDSGIGWIEVFVGGGVAAVAAAVSAGLGVAALAPRMVPPGSVEVGRSLGLPTLPRLPILLHSRHGSRSGSQALERLAGALRDSARRADPQGGAPQSVQPGGSWQTTHSLLPSGSRK